MATKVCCDVCDRQLEEGYDLPEAMLAQDFRVFTGLRGPKTGGYDVCKYCIIDAFKKLDDRQPAKAGRGELGRGNGMIDPHTARFVVDPQTGAWIKSNFLDPISLPLPSGWQIVSLVPDDGVFESACRTVMARSSQIVGPGTARSLWQEILLLLRSK